MLRVLAEQRCQLQLDTQYPLELVTAGEPAGVKLLMRRVTLRQ
jgi:hypothetical protein